MSQIALLPETVYHVYTHANGFENLIHFMIKIRSEQEVIEFINLKNLNKLKAAGIEESVVKERILQGFKTLGEFSINTSRQFRHLFNAFTQAFNKMHNRKGGSLFIPNFKRKEIMIKKRSEQEILEFINIKNLNKLKAAGIEESVVKERTLQGF